MKFQSTPSSRKVTFALFQKRFTTAISIHTFLAEGDVIFHYYPKWIIEFQSTPSSRKVTYGDEDSKKWVEISIHTFLAEGDPFKLSNNADNSINFNPHLPRGRWQLTVRTIKGVWYFNPHLPRGRWHCAYCGCTLTLKISIHTFLAEGDFL